MATRSSIARIAKHATKTPSRVLSTEGAAWVPKEQTKLMDATRQALVYSLSKVQSTIAESLVPWFTTNMPESYFKQVEIDTQINHMRTLSASFDHAKGNFAAGAGRVVFRSELPDGGFEVTYMDMSGNRQGLLAEQLSDLMMNPVSGVLSRVKAYVSKDQRLVFNIFTFSPQKSGVGGGEVCESLRNYADSLWKAEETGIEVDPGIKWSPLFEKDQLDAYAKRCNPDFVLNTGPRSFLKQYELFSKVAGTEDVAMSAEPANIKLSKEAVTGSGQGRSFEGADQWGVSNTQVKNGYWLRMAITNSVPLSALKKTLELFNHRGVAVERMHLDSVCASDTVKGKRDATDNVSMMRMLITPPPNAKESWLEDLQRDTKRMKWTDDLTMKLSTRTIRINEHSPLEEVGIQRAEVVTCLSSMLYSMLHAQDGYAFSKTNINNVVENARYLRLATKIADLFTARFNPVSPLSEDEFKETVGQLRSEIESDVQEDSVAREVLHRMISVTEYTLRTNLFLDDRYALAIRVDTKLLTPGNFNKPFDISDTEIKPSDGVIPFGVFYVHGRRFNGFHVRFRDIARGGMRLVSPQTAEQLAIEASRQYSEAYNLAFAQQAKNKDIPEGGSKCVLLVDVTSLPPSSGTEGKNNALRKSVKAFTDSMLDLIVDTANTREHVRDLYGKQELVYLGPDEQVIPEDINWIVGRAAQRGYPIPAAFMSSKPDAGINHKEFGVTSEGVQVFLDVALREMGMHPSQNDGKPFTVKMTGGPDGDVAGNMIRIMQREYGDKVKIVGLADGTGCAEDPNGLDIDELMRLFKEARPLSEFNSSLLSSHPDAALHICHQSAHGDNSASLEKALRARNTMHNRVKSDCFVPAGGRPATIHEGNWRAFLDPETGKPSSQLIVEGANLFCTPGARDLLHKATGIPIVKDSSANKCGVICSSFEIMSSMLLSEQEFHDIKPELVKDVLVRLRLLAQREAELLFREFRTLSGSLPELSMRQSNAMNVATDAVAEYFDEHTGGDYSDFMYLVDEHMPDALTEAASDRLMDRVPKEYIKRTIASAIACKVVYAEGSPFVENQDDKTLANLCFNYLKAEKKMADVNEALAKLNWNGDDNARDLTQQIVREGGIRTFLNRGNLEK